MRVSLVSTLAFLLLLGGPMLAANNTAKLTLDDIFASTQFRGKTVSDVQWLPDGSAFTFTRTSAEGATEIWRHDVATGKENLILEGDKLTINGNPVEMTAYQTTGNQDHLLITGSRKQIWRHSFSAPYYLYQMSKKTLLPLAGGDSGLQNVALSPDGKSVGFAKENNLYVASVATGKATQLTSDGSFNILNGIFDWVYEEEFGRSDAFRWSPDGKKIAFWWFDQTRVKTFTLLDELPYYSEPFSLKYPKVGEQNAIVKIGVVDVSNGKVTWMDLGKETDIYIPRIDWTSEKDKLSLQRLSRKQNHLELLVADANSGKTHKVLEDRNEAWIDVTDDFQFLSEGRFLFTSEKSGWRHIYLADMNGKEKQLTKGEWEVANIIGTDTTKGHVYFNAKYDGATEQGLFRIGLDGGEVSRVSAKGGWHSGIFSPDFKHYVGFSSSVTQPTTVTLHTSEGKSVRALEKNHIAALADFEIVYPEFSTFKTTDGTELNCYTMKPADFDPNKKYPVLIFGYGGPGSQMVVNRWGTGGAFRHLQRTLWHQYLTEQGYIIFCLDNRGTGGRGKAFKNLSYGDLSKWSVHDQIEGAKYMGRQSYVDAKRIGFWGWSGGGYLTAMIMMRGADYFSTGIAVASVGDFRNYDTIWTERYMGLLSENKKGYDAADVLTYTEGLKGNLLLVHGTGDDNVHPGNTWQIIDALVAKNKKFDMMFYPNRNHRINGGNTSRHLFTLMADYIQENL